jgi:hypothetical protein
MLGQTNLIIDEFGNMQFCYIFDTKIGNVNDGTIKKTWRGAVARQKRKEIKACRQPCIALACRSRSLREKATIFFKYLSLGKIQESRGRIG